MKVLRWHWPVLLLLVAASLVAGEAALVPPIAPRVEHRETRHGQIVTDDYFWLREKTNPAVIEYLQAENAYTDSLTQGQKPLEETLYQEMLGRIKQNDLRRRSSRASTTTIRGPKRASSIPCSVAVRAAWKERSKSF